MKLLLHTCCGPCAVYPVGFLKRSGMSVMGFFYRHNIHPYTECQKREETLLAYAEAIEMKIIVQEGYDLEGFLRNVAFREADRCRYCYHDRLRATALLARHGRFDCFSSTLLYSKFQKHDMIREIGDAVGREVGIRFFYHDFREGWKEGIAESKARGMYRQPYCGCIYSEKERYVRSTGGKNKQRESGSPPSPESGA